MLTDFGGDLNAKNAAWGDMVHNLSGKVLHKLQQTKSTTLKSFHDRHSERNEVRNHFHSVNKFTIDFVV